MFRLEVGKSLFSLMSHSFFFFFLKCSCQQLIFAKRETEVPKKNNFSPLFSKLILEAGIMIAF